MKNLQTKTLAVLYLSYSDKKDWNMDRPAKELKKIVQRIKTNTYIVYINNAIQKPAPAKKISQNEHIISGDNKHWEFSGWQKGINFLKQQKLKYDVLLLANDTFLDDSFLHRRLINNAAVSCAIKHNAMIGSRNRLPINSQVLGASMCPYARTHIFLMAKVIADNLLSFVRLGFGQQERFFSREYTSPKQFFRKDAPITNELKEYIFNYLTKNWKRKVPYTKEYYKFYKDKAMAILNSMMLSYHTMEMYYPLIDFKKVKFFLRRDDFPNIINSYWNKNVQIRLRRNHL